MAERRLFTKAELRQHLGGIAWSEVCIRMERGQIPRPLWNVPAEEKTARWDRRAVDRAIDAASSIPSSIESDTAELDRAIGIRG
jgi:hypothetical protein